MLSISTSTETTFDVKNIVASASLETHFQPIISVRRNQTIGVEALSRGRNADGTLIPPLDLFRSAAAQNLVVELDYLCRLTSLRNFLPLHKANPNLILFLNCHTTSKDEDVCTLLEMVEVAGIDPRNVAMEILESRIDNTASLQKLVEGCRENGFLVAIDDIGVGYSNLDRIALTKPDILKADLSLIRNMHRDYYKREIFKSIVQLSEKIGGWVLAEGVECKDEAVTILESGGDMIQGFYLSRPRKIESGAITYRQDHLDSAAQTFKQRILHRVKHEYYQREERTATANSLARSLCNLLPDEFEPQLRQDVAQQPMIVSASVITDDGIQFTETVLNITDFKPEKTIISPPPAKGANHSLKEYFYILMESRIYVYETPPYVPLPSEQLCVTVSTVFKDRDNREFILCLHMKAD